MVTFAGSGYRFPPRAACLRSVRAAGKYHSPRSGTMKRSNSSQPIRSHYWHLSWAQAAKLVFEFRQGNLSEPNSGMTVRSRDCSTSSLSAPVGSPNRLHQHLRWLRENLKSTGKLTHRLFHADSSPADTSGIRSITTSQRYRMLLDTAGFDGLNATVQSDRDSINHIMLASPVLEPANSMDPTIAIKSDDPVEDISLKTTLDVGRQSRHSQQSAGIECVLNGVACVLPCACHTARAIWAESSMATASTDPNRVGNGATARVSQMPLLQTSHRRPTQAARGVCCR